jgi:hypothetical protein
MSVEDIDESLDDEDVDEDEEPEGLDGETPAPVPPASGDEDVESIQDILVKQ